MNPRIVCLLFLLQAVCPAAMAESEAPVSAKELVSVQTIYAEAQKQEAEALAAFREIRAMQSSRALQITLEEARQRLQIPSPARPPIDLSILQLARPDPARVVEQRQTLRDVNARIDEILTFVRQLKEQLKEEEVAAEAITLDALRAELAMRDTSDKLAAEDEGEPSKDMTEAAFAGEPSPADQAVVDAMVANQAASEAEKMAAESAAKKQDVAPQAQAAAAESRKAAADASKAASEAKTAAKRQDAENEAKNAKVAAAKSADAVAAAIKVARITGQISFVAAAEEHTKEAAATKDAAAKEAAAKAGADGDKVSSKELGGFTPGATKFLPGKARPSRRIGGLGAGIEWIYIDSWYVLGPFPNPNRRNVDTSYPPESVIDLDASYTGDRGMPLKWEFIQSPSPYVIPTNPTEYMIYYAYSELWCDEDMDLWVMAGSDDSSRIWVNDQLIWKSGYRLKPWRLDEGLRKVSFRRGINRVLYRIENGWGLVGFSFAINLTPVQTSTAPATGKDTSR